MNSGGIAVTPSEIKRAVSRTCAQFSGYEQHDSQEFMRFLLDRMHDELNRVARKPGYKELNFQNVPLNRQSEEWAEYFKARDDSIITDLFGGQFVNKTECLSCGFKDWAFDTFLDLSVEFDRKGVRITGMTSVQDCLNRFFAPEEMRDTGFKCDGCKMKVNIEKQMTIYRFPKILVIHLKRFYHTAMRREKINTLVNFPKQINMKEYGPHSGK